MTLIKTSLLNAVAVIIKIVTLIGLNKILAIYVGPTGYAAMGQFQNAVQMITTLASGAINTGVTKYTAEYKEEEVKQHAVWRTAGTISLLGSVLVAITMIILNKQLASWFFKDAGLGSVFIWFAGALILFVFNSLLLAIFNGKKEIHRYVTANIAGSIFAMLVTSILAIKFGLYGALVALAIYQSLTFFVTLTLASKAKWFSVKYLFGKLDKEATRNLVKFTAMAITSATCVPLSHIIIRNHLGDTLGLESAGYWEAMWRLSTAYLMVITTTLSVYYLPRFSELKDSHEIISEIIQGYKIILPFSILCGVVIYTLRDLIIIVLFTPEFVAMEVLFSWQILGDIFKVGSWLLSFLILSKGMYRVFIFSEIIFSITFVCLSIYLTGILELKGMAIAHAINYFIYWVFMAVVLFTCFLKLKESNKN